MTVSRLLAVAAIAALFAFPAAAEDTTLLSQMQPDGRCAVWHDRGEVDLTGEELAELVLPALPEGGKNVVLDKYHAKAYSTKIGVIAAVWQPVAKSGR
jgi:hypothetical protein